MQKFLRIFTLMIAMCISGVASAQGLSEYTLSVDNGTFQSIATTGTALSFTSLDDGYATFNLPFAFSFGETVLPSGTPVACSANGFMYLNQSIASGTTASSTSTTYLIINPIMASDAHLGRHTGAGAYWEYDSNNDVVTIEYNGLGSYGTNGGLYNYLTFQVKLYATGVVEFVYDSVNWVYTDNTMMTYLRDGPNNEMVAANGPWDAPVLGTTASARPTSPLPVSGLVYSFNPPAGASCSRPASISLDDVATDYLSLVWPASDDASAQYIVEYATSMFTPGTGDANVEMASTNAVTLSNLEANTLYYVSVRALCSLGDTTAPRWAHFRTACSVMSVPFTESFETADENTSSTPGDQWMPCWRLFNEAAYHFPYIYRYNTYAHTGTTGLYWYATSAYGPSILMLPEFEEDVNTLQLRFWAKSSDISYHPEFVVGVLTDADSMNSFVPVDTVSVPNTTSWTEFEVPLNAFQGTEGRIALASFPGSSYWYAYVDDITVEAIPTCIHPVDAHVVGVTSDEITVAWTERGEATEWIVEYDTVDFTPGSGDAAFITSANDTVITLTDLDVATHYYIYISSDCGGGDVSSAIFVEAVTLAGDPMDLPYSTNFDDIEGWNLAGIGQTNHWANIDSMLVVTSDGITPGYNNASTSHSYAYLPINVEEAGSYVVSYDWACYGEGSYDYIRAFIAPAGAQFTPGICPDGVTTSTYSFGGQVPAGWMALDGEMRLNGHSTMQNVSMDLNIATPGTYFVVFYWGNDGSGGSTPAGMIDNFSMFQLTCPYVTNVEVSSIAGTSALLSWSVGGEENEGDVPSYAIVVTDENGSSTNLTANESPIFLTGLTPQTSYTVAVSRDCNGENINWDSTAFHTACLAGGNVVVGEGVNQISGVPVNSGWGNTACQSIYTAAELLAAGVTAGPITGLAYTWTLSSSYDKEFSIFIDATTATGFASATASNWQPITTPAYTGSHPIGTQGTVQYTFTTPFIWDGVSNIVVTSFMNQPTGASHTSSGFYGLSTTTSSNMSMYKYQDNTAFTAAGLSSIAPSAVSNARPSLLFLTPCEENVTCAAPNAVVVEVGADNAHIMWAPGLNETAWSVMINDGSDTWNTVASNITVTDYTITNLDANTQYTVRVVPNCGADTVYATLSFRTACMYAALPFSENFDNGFNATSTLGSTTESCWNRLSNDSYTNYPYLDSYYHASGSNSMYFYGSSPYYSILVLPAFEPVVDTLTLSLAAYITGSGYTLQYGAMTDPEDASTFELLGTIAPTTYSQWQNFEFPLNNYTGNGHYIALRAPASNYTYMYIDDIEVAYTSSCPRPTNVAVSNISTNGADVTWVDSAATNFEVEYGPAGFAHGTGTSVIVNGASTVTLAGLNHSTLYDVYVRGLCSDFDTSNWSFATHFATECGMLDVFPFTENFDAWGSGSNVQAPNCWSYGSTYSSSYPYISSSYGYNSSSSLYMYCYTAGNVTWAMMPAIDTTIVSMNQMMVSFYSYSSYASYTHPIIVGVSSTPNYSASDFVAIDTIIPTYNQWNMHEVYFDGYTGNGKYVTFLTTPWNGESAAYPYLDAVTLEQIGDCARPNHLTATNATANSITLGWTDHCTASSWIIEYGAQGFTPGTGTTVVANSNPFTLTNLPASFVGEYYVRVLCGAGDTSSYSRQACLFNTSQVPATIPYSYNFEDATEWANWQTSTNNTVNWYRGTADASQGSYSMYISNDGGNTIGTVATATNVAAYRDIDFGANDSSFTFSFKAKMGGSTDGRYDALMVFLVDPSIAVEASNSAITSPWGNVNDLYRISLAYLDTTWNEYTASFDGVSGVQRVAFFWFNQNLSSFIGEPAAVDEISINYSACPRPYDVEVVQLGATNATLTWTGAASAEYQVIYRPYPNGTSNTFVTTNTNSITLTNLESLTQYAVWVRKICGADTSLTSDGLLFTTGLCDNGVIAENFDATMPTSTTSYLPGYSFYNYSFSEVIIDSATIANAGIVDEIVAFAFNPTSTAGGNYFENCDVYMANVSASDLSTGFILQDTTWTEVITNGDLCYSETGWQIHGFDVPFMWDGHSNVLLAVNRRHGSYASGSTFAAHTHSAPVARYIYQDGSQYYPSNPTGGSEMATNIAPDYRLYSCGAGCAMPTLTNVTNVDFDNATINWSSNATDFEVSILNNGAWSAETAVANAYSYTFTNLQPATTYQYRVRAICDAAEGLISDWAMGNFTTDSLPCFAPTDLAVSNVQGQSAVLSWTAGSNETAWNLHVFNTTTDLTFNANATTYTVTGLTAGVTYYAAVSALCGGGVEISDWSDTVEFTTVVCDPVTNVTASGVTNNSAIISWTAGANNTGSWEVAWNYHGAGMTQPLGSQVVQATSFTINGLSSETPYDVAVRAICGDNYNSTYAETQFTTLAGQGIARVDDGLNVSIFPNPASGNTTITLSGVNGSVTLTVVDMSGRTVKTATVECNGDCEKKLDVNGLAAGAYFVRVAGENVNTVKKLIVK